MLDPEESALLGDARLGAAIAQFNAGDWYGCHDSFEELWHETAGPTRPVLQGLLQIAVGQLHLERGNRRGATILTGEGLGRLRGCPQDALGLDLAAVCRSAGLWLQALQGPEQNPDLEPPRLLPARAASQPSVD